MSDSSALEKELGGGNGAQAATCAAPHVRMPAPILPPAPAAHVPALTVTTPPIPGVDPVTRDAWKEQEAAAERRAAGIREPPPGYESSSASSSSANAAGQPSAQVSSPATQQPQQARTRPSNTAQTAATTAAAVAIAAAAQAPVRRARSSTIGSGPEEKGSKVDDRKWYSKKRTFFGLTASLIVILVVALVCNYVVFKNQGPPNGSWHHRHRGGSENGTDVNDIALANDQSAAWRGQDNIFNGSWTINAPKLDPGADGVGLDDCASKSNIFTPCAEGRFIKSTDSNLNFTVAELPGAKGMFEAQFSAGIFGDDSGNKMVLRPSSYGLTTNYDYELSTGKKSPQCGYGRGIQILLTTQNGPNNKMEVVYKITETHVISGDGCASDGGSQGDVCTCTYIGTRS